MTNFSESELKPGEDEAIAMDVSKNYENSEKAKQIILENFKKLKWGALQIRNFAKQEKSIANTRKGRVNSLDNLYVAFNTRFDSATQLTNSYLAPKTEIDQHTPRSERQPDLDTLEGHVLRSGPPLYTRQFSPKTDKYPVHKKNYQMEKRTQIQNSINN